jgi:hypothetical protein
VESQKEGRRRVTRKDTMKERYRIAGGKYEGEQTESHEQDSRTVIRRT